MYWKFGQHRSANGEASPTTFEVLPIRNDRRARYGMSYVIRVRGQLQASGPPALTTAANALLAAFETDDKDFAFYDDNDQPTVYQILTAQTIGGVKVLDGPRFIDRPGSYTTYLDYEFSVGAELPPGQGGGGQGPGANILRWQETISLVGTGGPRRVLIIPLAGNCIEQFTSTKTPYRAIQRGRAAGIFSTPIAPNPIWPAALDPESSTIEPGTPEGIGTSDREWPVSWTYSYISTSPLAGLPTPRPT